MFFRVIDQICSQCVRVLRDYTSILGATADVNHDTAAQLLGHSPVVSYLLSAERLSKEEPEYKFLYDVSLDKLRISSAKTAFPPGDVLQLCTQKAASADTH